MLKYNFVIISTKNLIKIPIYELKLKEEEFKDE